MKTKILNPLQNEQHGDTSKNYISLEQDSRLLKAHTIEMSLGTENQKNVDYHFSEIETHFQFCMQGLQSSYSF